jgi:hypothetical protein
MAAELSELMLMVVGFKNKIVLGLPVVVEPKTYMA